MRRKLIMAAAAAITLVCSGPATAQDDDHGYITVRTTQVKTGHAAQYREMLGKLTASRKAAGHSGVNVFQSIRGPVSTYYMVLSHDTMAEAGVPFESGMSDSDWAQWLSRMGALIESSQLVTLEAHRDLGIAPPEGSTANMVILRTRTLMPGNNNEYHDLIEERLRPALIAGGIKGWNVSKVVMGDNPNMWFSATRVESWEQLDQPGALADMNDRQRESMFEDMNEMTVSNNVELLRWIPELSY